MKKQLLKDILAAYESKIGCREYRLIKEKADWPASGKTIKKIYPGAVVKCVLDCIGTATFGVTPGKEQGEYVLLVDRGYERELSVWRRDSSDAWKCLFVDRVGYDT